MGAIKVPRDAGFNPHSKQRSWGESEEEEPLQNVEMFI